MTIIVALGIILGLWGSREAGEGSLKLDSRCRVWDDATQGVQMECTVTPREYLCEQKMKEAMKVMNAFVPRIYDTESTVIEGWMKHEHTSQQITAARKQWDAVIQECVR